MSSRLASSVLVLGLLTASCGPSLAGHPAAARGSLPAREPAGAALRISNHLGWPMQLDRIVVAVDGNLAFLRTRGAPGPLDGELLRVRLPPGEHTVALLVDASAPCGLLAQPRGTARVVQYRAVRIEAPAGFVTAEVSRRVMGDAIEVAWRGEGARIEPVGAESMRSSPRAPLVAASCPREDPVIHALCRIEALRVEAVNQRDIIWVNCLRDKQVQMQATREIIARIDAEASGSAHNAALRAAATQRIESLAAEGEQCIGEDILVFDGGSDGRIVCPVMAAPASDITLRWGE